MNQDEIERLICEGAPEYHAPPEPPRDAMWAAIREMLPRNGRISARGDTGDIAARRARRLRRDRLRSLAPWALGLATAATLALGYGLGHITRERAPAAPAPAAVADSERVGPSLPVRLAAANHMGEAEAMLTLFRTSDRADDRLATARWARDLLSTTRMLLDSRVAEDPQLATLLSDLELVLVQISIAAAEADPTDQQLIEEGIEQLQLLAKLRAAAETPTGMAM